MNRALLLAVLVAACGGDDPTAPLDGGPPPSDGGRDASVDAALMDGGTSDARMDGGDPAEGIVVTWIDSRETNEGGAAVRATLSLGRQPGGLVDIIVSTTNENLLVPNRRRVRFARTTWDTPEEIVLTPSDDTLARGDAEIALFLSAQSADSEFDGDLISETVLVRDDERALVASSVAVSASAACAVSGGDVSCWGAGSGGILGSGDETDARLPRSLGLDTITAVALGERHALARDQSGAVHSWGTGPATGQGDGLHGVDRVAGLEGVTAVVAGDAHSCALLESHELRCWGAGEAGQLGDGGNVRRDAPVSVADDTGPLSDIVGVAAGGRSTCAIRDGGSVVCWGANDAGELGIEGPAIPRPGAAIPGLGDVVQLVAGDAHYCARLESGLVRCWGDRELMPWAPIEGEALVDLRAVPVATELAAGARHTCATSAGGRVHCWGRSEGGLVGHDQWYQENVRGLYPIPQPLEVNLEGIAAGGANLCGRRVGDGAVVCVGDPASPVLHADGWTDSVDALASPALRIPVGRRVTLGGVRANAAADEQYLDGGEASTCMQGENEWMLCWGGDPTTYAGGHATNLEVPMTVATQHASFGFEVRERIPRVGPLPSVQMGPTNACFIERGALVHCGGGPLGFDPTYTSDQEAIIPRGVTLTDVGRAHVCGVHNTDVLVCNGQNDRGELGLSSTPAPNDLTSATVGGLETPTQVALGYQHTCAIHDGGSVACWGANDRAQTGRPGGDQPTAGDTGVTGAFAISAGGDATCAITGDPDAGGTLSCWGAFGAEAASETPVAHPTLTAVRAVDLSPGRPETPAQAVGCALTGDDAAGALMCWGVFGGTWAAPAEATSWSAAEHRVIEFSVSNEHVCWLGLGHVRCRGNSALGRLGSYDLYGPRVIRAE